ncbi:hypothetical protein RB195_019364 [Necator americanus]|uniref:Uncharacterized protein n=1 Tax=Necator americanus TaxID=51031 RepID=A0ABR1CGD4_NECAM
MHTLITVYTISFTCYIVHKSQLQMYGRTTRVFAAEFWECALSQPRIVYSTAEETFVAAAGGNYGTGSCIGIDVMV